MRYIGVLRSHKNLPHKTENCIKMRLRAYVEFTLELRIRCPTRPLATRCLGDPTPPLEVTRPPGHRPPLSELAFSGKNFGYEALKHILTEQFATFKETTDAT